MYWDFRLQCRREIRSSGLLRTILVIFLLFGSYYRSHEGRAFLENGTHTLLRNVGKQQSHSVQQRMRRFIALFKKYCCLSYPEPDASTSQHQTQFSFYFNIKTAHMFKSSNQTFLHLHQPLNITHVTCTADIVMTLSFNFESPISSALLSRWFCI